VTWLSALRRGDFGPSSLENPLVPLTSSSLLDLFVGPKSNAGVPVNEKTGLAMPAVYRAIALIAGTGGSLPFHAFTDDAATDSRKLVKPTPWQIASPHPDLTRLRVARAGLRPPALLGQRLPAEGQGRARADAGAVAHRARPRAGRAGQGRHQGLRAGRRVGAGLGGRGPEDAGPAPAHRRRRSCTSPAWATTASRGSRPSAWRGRASAWRWPPRSSARSCSPPATS
jgi:hypothetical protein